MAESRCGQCGGFSFSELLLKVKVTDCNGVMRWMVIICQDCLEKTVDFIESESGGRQQRHRANE